MRPQLQFWFDFASTYSFLTAMRIERLAAEAEVGLEWRPFMLGVVLRERGWQGNPADTFPAKGAYMWRDIERRALLRGHGFRKPSVFPRNPVLANRVAQVAAEEGWCGGFMRRAYAANFIEDREIGEPEVIAQLVAACDRDPAIVLERAQSQPVRDALRRNTEAALAKGLFGAPSFVVGEELFWGDDRLEDALAWCGDPR